MKVGKRVREVGDTGPYRGKVIEELDGGQVRVAWWSDRLMDYDHRDSDVMSSERLEELNATPDMIW